MIALVALASISRCAVPELCPTDEQLLAAVRAWQEECVEAVYEQAMRENPDSLVSVHAAPIERLSNVVCGDRLPGEVPTITCRFTLRHSGSKSYHVARLVGQGSGWKIEEALAVTRRRR